MGRITGCQRRMLRLDHTSDQCVAQLTRLALRLPGRHEIARLLRSCGIEGNDAAVKLSRTSSKLRVSRERRFPSGMISNPNCT